MKKITGVLLSVLFATNLFAQSNIWKTDPAHTSVRFAVTHMVINEVEGKFTSFNGTMTSSKPDFTDAQIEFTVEVKSISTDNEMRDNHLKSADFFNADSFPQMKFRSTSIKKISDKKYLLEGDLTIRDVTKRVTFDVTYGGTIKDSYGNTRAGFKATARINRLDYHLNWNKTMEAGAVVSADVDVIINTEFIQQK
ncbi:MAG TPA: YceI family protein [Chitinophagales bacterium]|nr:YceI family protein [Chitinophagales bacterium]